jgi:hypothetical protein
MSDFPTEELSPLHLHTNMFTFPSAMTLRLIGSALVNPVSIAWPTANLALYIPFKVTVPYPVKRLFWMNGSGTLGNVDVGVYTRGGGKITSTGSTAQSGASTPQYANASPVVLLTPNVYYLSMSCSVTTNGVFGHPSTAVHNRLAGLLQQASAVPLPSTATFAAAAVAGYPLAGITRTASGF